MAKPQTRNTKKARVSFHTVGTTVKNDGGKGLGGRTETGSTTQGRNPQHNGAAPLPKMPTEGSTNGGTGVGVGKGDSRWKMWIKEDKSA